MGMRAETPGEGPLPYMGLAPGRPFPTPKDSMFTTGDSGLEVDPASLGPLRQSSVLRERRT